MSTERFVITLAAMAALFITGCGGCDSPPPKCPTGEVYASGQVDYGNVHIAGCFPKTLNWGDQH